MYRVSSFKRKKGPPPFFNGRRTKNQHFTFCRCNSYMYINISTCIWYLQGWTLTHPKKLTQEKPEADLSQALLDVNKFSRKFPLFSIPPRLVCAQRTYGARRRPHAVAAILGGGDTSALVPWSSFCNFPCRLLPSTCGSANTSPNMPIQL